MNNTCLFDYRWNLSNNYQNPNIENHKLKVFSTFACGGGSTMGYKLAGFDVIGANDIDPQMSKVYQENHKPKHYFLCPINELLTKDLPGELYNLDILDGSPPCSTFSMAGSREKAFKIDKIFREGQAKQVLSDLFFDWIRLVDKLKPKIAIAENVKGMLAGNAKAYTSEVLRGIDKIGYDVQLFCLNGASMGLPQKRERVFFICKRKDLKLPNLKIQFNEKPILFKEIKTKSLIGCKKMSDEELKYWKIKTNNDSSLAQSYVRLGLKENRFTTKWEKDEKVLNTITAGDNNILFSEPRKLNNIEYSLAGSFPLDYNFLDIQPRYLIGMSVPPLMTAQISYQIYLQLLKNINIPE